MHETAIVKSHMRNEQFYNTHTPSLQELHVGDTLHFQNLAGR